MAKKVTDLMTTYQYILIFSLPFRETWFSSIKTIQSTNSVVANLLHLVNIIFQSLHSAQSCQTLQVENHSGS